MCSLYQGREKFLKMPDQECPSVISHNKVRTPLDASYFSSNFRSCALYSPNNEPIPKKKLPSLAPSATAHDICIVTPRPDQFTHTSAQLTPPAPPILTSLPQFCHMTAPSINRTTVMTKSGQELSKLRIFVGFDPREELAYEVCRNSILKHATIPVEVIPIKQQNLKKAGIYTRARGPTESTEFSFTRFLTPFLAGFEGWALFVDCDFLYTADVRELAELIDQRYAIMCVHHDYSPTATRKMDGALQTSYPRKNWSSMVLYNCSHPKNKVLTPALVNSQSGAFLHRFMWLEDGDIGDIPFTWNFLVGHHGAPKEGACLPKAIHYTSGGPWFEDWKECEFADLWLLERDHYWRMQCVKRYLRHKLLKLVGTTTQESSSLKTHISNICNMQ